MSNSENVSAQDATFSDPLNNRTYFHPTLINVLKGIEAGCSGQTNLVGVQPNPKTAFVYVNGSYKISKNFYCGHGLSITNDKEGNSPSISTTSIKVNAVNLRWFYKKFEGLNCDNYQNKPYVSMGLYIGMFNKSLNSGDLIFSKQITEWSANPISTADIELYKSVNKTDIGGNIEIRFPISKLFLFNRDNWSGNLCYSVHHLQSPTNSIKATEASFLIQNQNVVLPRYNVYTLSILNKVALSRELFIQYERQKPIQRIIIGTNFFLHKQFSLTLAASNYNVHSWIKNVNTIITTVNFFTPKIEKSKSTSIYKFYFSYTSVISGLGISPVVNKFGSVQVGIKFSKNTDCNFLTTECITL
jgi:hypothetical protein